MASLKDMRTRIASVKATRKITKAMQMVAAAKLRRAQEAATAARPYAERMERVLANLLSSQRLSVDHHVLSLLTDQPFFRFEAPVETLGLTRESHSAQALGKLHQLRRHVNRIAPDLVHGWLYHGNAFAVGAAGLGIPILWAIHNTTLSATRSKRSTRLLDRVCAALSRYVPTRILYCSETARLVLETLLSAAEAGTVAVSYARLTGFVKAEGRIVGATVVDRLGDRAVTIRARTVVNAAGPWVDVVTALDMPAPPLLRPTKGVHLVVPRARVLGAEVSVCGDAASDPEVIPLLIKAGVEVLSVAPAAIGRVKRAIAEIK